MDSVFDFGPAIDSQQIAHPVVPEYTLQGIAYATPMIVGKSGGFAIRPLYGTLINRCSRPRLCKNVEELSDWRFYALRRCLNFGSMSLMKPRRTGKEPCSGSHRSN
jgi:hypothetical protein